MFRYRKRLSSDAVAGIKSRHSDFETPMVSTSIHTGPGRVRGSERVWEEEKANTGDRRLDKRSVGLNAPEKYNTN